MEAMPATMTDLAQAEVRLSGRSIAPGLGMGQVWVVSDAMKWSGPPTPIAYLTSRLLNRDLCESAYNSSDIGQPFTGGSLVPWR